VTQAQWRALMGNNPSQFKGNDLPVEMISWEEAGSFCKKLTDRAKAAGTLPAGSEYRLPTEAEWEYACRAGSATAYSFGDSEAALGEYAWHQRNSGKTTHPVGEKKPNAWGLYDMHGNVWEWCWDWYGDYPADKVINPAGAMTGTGRVRRGGCLDNIAGYCRAAFRTGDVSGYRDGRLGFRVALAPALRQAAAAPAAGSQDDLVVDLGGGVTMPFVLIRSGSFQMGSEKGDANEKPVRQVTISKPFYMGKYEVTQEQWSVVMGDNPSIFKGAKNPVENVSWEDCQKFAAKLQEKVPGQSFSLPTEAEWEYACRAGSATEYGFGDIAPALGEYAWHNGNSGDKTHPVGAKKPNAWGLYDMHGNVWEWCADRSGSYLNAEWLNPVGPAGGDNRVMRGGYWGGNAGSCRSAFRFKDLTGARTSTTGFRLTTPWPKETIVVDLGGGVTMPFVLIQSGCFMMGSEKGKDNEKPVRQVTITKPFYMGKYEVTQEQWERVMGGNPSAFKGAKHPVEQVSWNDCQKFAAKLQEKLPGQTFRLPTEAEWEYACRAGTTTEYSFGDAETALGGYAWYKDNSGGATHPVGLMKPNAWGLYDMHGSVWELCADWHDAYPGTAESDPQGPPTGKKRAARGGSWGGDAGSCRSALRTFGFSHDIGNCTGFRLVKTVQ
jgi:formylglycine-generating enzyme required for sulfatase activity